MTRAHRVVSWMVVIAAAGCFPTTTRPAFLPVVTAPTTEIELAVPQATRALALALDGDSIPVRRTEASDGWLETPWFDANTLQPTTARPLGPDVVRVRAWIDPGRANHSNVTVETVYAPMADPSRPERSLERQVAPDHPVSARVTKVMRALAKEYGGVDSTVQVKHDSIKGSTPPDSIRKLRPDSVRKVRPDSSAAPARQ